MFDVTLFDSVRCEACELQAARLAYAAKLGASEWEAFIDRVPVCEDCYEVRKRLAVKGMSTSQLVPSVDVLAAQVRTEVAHIARGCRSSLSHNPAVHEQALAVALDALVACVTEAEARAENLKAFAAGKAMLNVPTTNAPDDWALTYETITDDECPCLKPSHKRLEVALADARNALERIAQLTAQDRTPRETWTTTENAAAAGLEPARKVAREVLARLDGNQP